MYSENILMRLHAKLKKQCIEILAFEEILANFIFLQGGAALGGPGGGSSGSGMRVFRISSLGGLDPETAEIAEEQLLGTDFMFFVAFAG